MFSENYFREPLYLVFAYGGEALHKGIKKCPRLSLKDERRKEKETYVESEESGALGIKISVSKPSINLSCLSWWRQK